MWNGHYKKGCICWIINETTYWFYKNKLKIIRLFSPLENPYNFQGTIIFPQFYNSFKDSNKRKGNRQKSHLAPQLEPSTLRHLVHFLLLFIEQKKASRTPYNTIAICGIIWSVHLTSSLVVHNIVLFITFLINYNVQYSMLQLQQNDRLCPSYSTFNN